MTRLYSVPCKVELRFFDSGIEHSLWVRYTWESPVTGKTYTPEMLVFRSRPKEFVEKFHSKEAIDAALTEKGDLHSWVRGAIAPELRRELFELENSAGEVDVQKVIDLINNYKIEDFTAEVDLDRD